MLGLGSRLISFLLAGNMLVAYWTADHAALLSFFSDPGKFYVADPYTFLFASLMVLIFGAGFFSADTLLESYLWGTLLPAPSSMASREAHGVTATA